MAYGLHTKHKKPIREDNYTHKFFDNKLAVMASIAKQYNMKMMIYTPSSTGGSGGSDITVAASNSIVSAIAGVPAIYRCTGTNDDVVINAAITALGSTGGKVYLTAGDYYCGTSSTSGILIANYGVELEGAGREKGSIIHAPTAFAPTQGAVVKLTQTPNYGAGVKNLNIVFDNPSGVTAHGIWTLCNNPQIQNVEVLKAGGCGFLIDGTATGYQAEVTNCIATWCGSGTLGDGFQVTANAQNANLTDCLVEGGTGYAGALLTTGLTNGQTGITSLAVSPTVGTFTAGDIIIINMPNANSGASTTQQVVCATTTNAGATSIPVNSFTSNAAYTAGLTTIIDKTLMITRNGFNIQGISAHITNCHPYFCYEGGLMANITANMPIYIIGGEFESNGTFQINVVSSQQSVFSSYSVHGPCAYISMLLKAVVGFTLSAVFADGQYSTYAILVASCTSGSITGNTVTNGVGTGGTIGNGSLSVQGCNKMTVVGNTSDSSLSGGTNGFVFYSNTNSTFDDNNNVGSYTYNVGGVNTGSVYHNNRGYNPVGSTFPGTAFAIGLTTTPATNNTGVDITLYVTAIGIVTSVSVNGVVVRSTALVIGDSFNVPAGGTFTMTYSGAPTLVAVGN